MAYLYSPSGCDDTLGDHICDACPVPEAGRISAVAFIKTDYAFVDYEDAAEWLAAILTGDVKIIPDVNGTYDGGTATFGLGRGRQPKRKTGKIFKAPFFDFNLKGNDVFYNTLSNSGGWRIAIVGDTIMRISDNAVTIDPKDVVEEPTDSEVKWNIDVEFTQHDNPLHYDIPAGVFICQGIAA